MQSEKNKGGRPKAKFDYEKLDFLLKFKVKKSFCAQELGVCEATIDNRLKQDHGMTFGEYQDLKSQGTAFEAQVLAVKMALGQPYKKHQKEKECTPNLRLLELMLKNFAGWSDKIEAESDHTVNVNVKSYGAPEE